MIEFVGFPKVPRLRRECIITEKIDGTNAQVYIADDGKMLFGSRNRWITPNNDNMGFARWAAEHVEELALLGPGHHFGEWWGNGIQRNYGLNEKRFSLFNVSRWTPETVPPCCHVVPILKTGTFSTKLVNDAIYDLIAHGSQAAPGWAEPEGVMIYMVAAGHYFKQTIEGDELPKGMQK